MKEAVCADLRAFTKVKIVSHQHIMFLITDEESTDILLLRMLHKLNAIPLVPRTPRLIREILGKWMQLY